MAGTNTDVIRPGLFNLNLNLMYLANEQKIEKRKQQLQNAKQHEHPTVHLVIDLMLSLLDNNLRKRTLLLQNIEKLEQNLSKRPQHLNTLADLASLYKEKHPKETCRLGDLQTTISQILESNTLECTKERALCLLEQGYALIFEEDTNNESEIGEKLHDAYTLLQIEQTISHDDRKSNILQKALLQTLKARREIATLACTPQQNVSLCRKKSLSVELITRGIQILKIIPEINQMVLWKYYLAIANDRLFVSMGNKENKSPTVTREMNDINVRTIELFWTVIHELSPDVDQYVLYKARSYAYMGHLLISRKERLNDMSLAKIKQFDNEEFKMYRESPKEPFERALKLLPNDEIVLGRWIMGLILLSKTITNDTENLENLQSLESMLSEYIQSYPEISMLARAIRMVALYEMSLKCVKGETKQKKMLLEARKDGIATISENLISHDICKLSDICQMLGKFPNIDAYGPRAVVDDKYLLQALDFLNNGIKKYGQNFYLASAFGKIYFDLGEFRKAREWAKRALLLGDQSRPHLPLRTLLFYILGQNDSTRKYKELLEVFKHVICLINDEERAKATLSHVLKKNRRDKLIPFMMYLHDTELSSQSIYVAELLRITIVTKFPNDDLAKEILQHTYVQSEDVFPKDDLPQRRRRLDIKEDNGDVGSKPTNIYKYDYCIIPSKDDAEWIKCFLYHQLQEKMFDFDEKFQGWLGEIDYSLSSSIVQTFLTVTKKSKKTILVISDSFLRREWSILKPFIMERVTGTPDEFLVVLLKNCTLPNELEDLSVFDFSQMNNIPVEIQNIKLALLEFITGRMK